jgi:hypothetical protein
LKIEAFLASPVDEDNSYETWWKSESPDYSVDDELTEE